MVGLEFEVGALEVSDELRVELNALGQRRVQVEAELVSERLRPSDRELFT